MQTENPIHLSTKPKNYLDSIGIGPLHNLLTLTRESHLTKKGVGVLQRIQPVKNNLWNIDREYL